MEFSSRKTAKSWWTAWRVAYTAASQEQNNTEIPQEVWWDIFVGWCRWGFLAWTQRPIHVVLHGILRQPWHDAASISTESDPDTPPNASPVVLFWPTWADPIAVHQAALDAIHQWMQKTAQEHGKNQGITSTHEIGCPEIIWQRICENIDATQQKIMWQNILLWIAQPNDIVHQRWMVQSSWYIRMCQNDIHPEDTQREQQILQKQHQGGPWILVGITQQKKYQMSDLYDAVSPWRRRLAGIWHALSNEQREQIDHDEELWLERIATEQEMMALVGDLLLICCEKIAPIYISPSLQDIWPRLQRARARVIFYNIDENHPAQHNAAQQMQCILQWLATQLSGVKARISSCFAPHDDDVTHVWRQIAGRV